MYRSSSRSLGTQPYASKLVAVSPTGGIDSIPELLRQPIGKTQNTLDPVPNLVSEWKRSDDGTAVTLVLREGMKWSDGEDLVAEDFMFFHDTVLRDEQFSPSWQQLLNVEKMGDLEVKYSFSTPNAWHPWFFQSQPVVPQHFLSKWHDRYNPNATELAREAGYENWAAAFETLIESPPGKFSGPEPVPSTSPYVLTVPMQGVTIWERNPFYWKVDATG